MMDFTQQTVQPSSEGNSQPGRSYLSHNATFPSAVHEASSHAAPHASSQAAASSCHAAASQTAPHAAPSHETVRNVRSNSTVCSSNLHPMFRHGVRLPLLNETHDDLTYIKTSLLRTTESKDYNVTVTTSDGIGVKKYPMQSSKTKISSLGNTWSKDYNDTVSTESEDTKHEFDRLPRLPVSVPGARERQGILDRYERYTGDNKQCVSSASRDTFKLHISQYRYPNENVLPSDGHNCDSTKNENSYKDTINSSSLKECRTNANGASNTTRWLKTKTVVPIKQGCDINEPTIKGVSVLCKDPDHAESQETRTHGKTATGTALQPTLSPALPLLKDLQSHGESVNRTNSLKSFAQPVALPRSTRQNTSVNVFIEYMTRRKEISGTSTIDMSATGPCGDNCHVNSNANANANSFVPKPDTRVGWVRGMDDANVSSQTNRPRRANRRHGNNLKGANSTTNCLGNANSVCRVKSMDNVHKMNFTSNSDNRSKFAEAKGKDLLNNLIHSNTVLKEDKKNNKNGSVDATHMKNGYNIGRRTHNLINSHTMDSLNVEPSRNNQSRSKLSTQTKRPQGDISNMLHVRSCDYTKSDRHYTNHGIVPERLKPSSSTDSECSELPNQLTETSNQLTEPYKKLSEQPKQSTEPPKPSTEPPKPSTEPPTKLTELPKPSTEPPKQSAEPSKHSTEPNKQSAEPPKPSTEPPTKLTEPPKPSTEPPKPSTEPPKPSTEPPKPSTEPPKPSTEPPKQSAEPSEQSTEPHKQSAELPKQSTEPPKQSAEQPKQSTEQQKQSAEPPKQSTEPPKQSTEPPKQSTELLKQSAEPLKHAELSPALFDQLKIRHELENTFAEPVVYLQPYNSEIHYHLAPEANVIHSNNAQRLTRVIHVHLPAIDMDKPDTEVDNG